MTICLDACDLFEQYEEYPKGLCIEMSVACCQPTSYTNSDRLYSQSIDHRVCVCVFVCTREHSIVVQCGNRTSALGCVSAETGSCITQL
jgi:hypothetical protein